jgi:DNA adenine methylase
MGGLSVGLDIADSFPNISLMFSDKDHGIASFWQVVSDSNINDLEHLLHLMETQPTIDLFYQLRESPPKNKLEAAYQSIFFNRCCFSGINIISKNINGKPSKGSSPIGGKSQLSKYKVDCRYNYKKLKAKILYCHDLLVGRTIVENKDFKDYLPTLDSNIPIYADPPYICKGDMLYNEKMSLEDHKELANLLNKRSNFVLSYDDHIEVREMYKDRRILDLAARYSIQGSKKNWTQKNELIILP